MEPLSSLELRGLDPGLVEAVGEAKLQMSMLPIIKNELKNKILLHRLRSGKGDIEFDEKKPKIKRELTDEEIQKKLRRKEQNRRAATRCRKKKKVIESKVQLDYFREQQVTSALQIEVENLRLERDNLLRVLEDHTASCVRAHTPNQLTTVSYDGQQVDQFSDDQFDDPFVGTTYQMYSSGPPNFQCKPEPEIPSCTATSGYPNDDLPLPPEFHDFASGFFHVPCSPELVLGRRSISEYLDDPETNCQQQQFIGL